MPKFSDLDLNALKTRLDQKHDDFMAEMKQKRIAHEKQINALSDQLDTMLGELKKFDHETKGAFIKK